MNSHCHYSNVIMSAMASQTTGVSIVCLTVCSGADQSKHQSSALLAFVRGIHRWPIPANQQSTPTRADTLFCNGDARTYTLACLYFYARRNLRWNTLAAAVQRVRSAWTSAFANVRKYANVRTQLNARNVISFDDVIMMRLLLDNENMYDGRTHPLTSPWEHFCK